MITFDPSLKIFTSSKVNVGSTMSGFGTKFLGDARKNEIVMNFFRINAIPHDSLVLMRQIHSVNIFEYKKEDSEIVKSIEETDGLITKEPGVVLVARTGDCVPIVYCDHKNNIIGISHQGWRGSLKKLCQKMVQHMLQMGAQLPNIQVAIGPSIGQCCYEISDDLYYDFLTELDGYSEKIFRHKQGKWHMNMLLLNYLLLLETGIQKKHIDFFPFCTKCDKKRFFSFRRDHPQEFGEMLSFIVNKT